MKGSHRGEDNKPVRSQRDSFLCWSRLSDNINLPTASMLMITQNSDLEGASGPVGEMGLETDQQDKGTQSGHPYLGSS